MFIRPSAGVTSASAGSIKKSSNRGEGGYSMLSQAQGAPKSSNMTIRPVATLDELKIVIGWAYQEGWNVGKYDAESFFKVFPNGCQLLLKDNKPIGSIFVARYTKDFACIAFFIVAKEHRRQGYGKMLWGHAMQMLAQTTTVRLHAVPQMISMYEKSKFQSSYDMLRWEMKTPDMENSSASIKKEKTIIPLSDKIQTLMAKVGAYDATLFPIPRFTLIEAMINMQQTFGFVAIKDDKVTGYGLIRPCESGVRVGPLCADDPESAKSLMLQLLSTVGTKQTIVLDTPPPTVNKWITAFAEYFKLDRVQAGDCKLMLKGNPVKAADDKIFSIRGLDLG